MFLPLEIIESEAKRLNHSEEYISEIIDYVRNLRRQNLPDFFSIQHLSLNANFDINYVLNICNSNRIEFYKKFKLKKRRGGFREISCPENELKYIQKWILKNILNEVQSHESSQGFDKGNSILQNAQHHLGTESILKIDLLRFYDTINEKRIFGVFNQLGYHSNLCVYLAKLTTVHIGEKSFKPYEKKLKNKILSSQSGVLPQGAPTSPKLANLVLRNLDRRLKGLSDKHRVNYSRYADDLTFSGDEYVLRNLKKIIYKIINDENFFVNYGKTQLLKRGQRYFITGLSVHNGTVKVKKKYKVNIEHHLHHLNKNGYFNHTQHSDIDRRNFRDWLLGSIYFVYSIEPEVGLKYFVEYNKIQWPL